MSPSPPSGRATVRREERSSYDPVEIRAILDEALYCHVGFVDAGSPMVIPMLHACIGEHLYLHGSPATRMFRLFQKGPQICVTATLLDGLVLARSAFDHSANYRSVVVFGVPEVVEDLDERAGALDAFTDKLVPGRRRSLRPMTEKEVRATVVIRLPLTEASAKIRTGPPVDEEADYALPIWAGVIPITQTFGDPIPDPRNLDGVTEPDHLGFFRV